MISNGRFFKFAMLIATCPGSIDHIKPKHMLKEFKEFAMSGNLIDIAVGLVMAAAFGTLTTAFVDGVFMPLVGMLFQVGDLNDAHWVLSGEVLGPNGEVVTPATAIHYGKFIAAAINFLIIALAMFMVVKSINRLKGDKGASAAS